MCIYKIYPDIHTYLTKRRKRSMSAETVIDSYDALSQSWSRYKSFLGQSKHETKYLITDLPKDIGKHSLFPVKKEAGGELSEDTSAKQNSKSQASETEKTIFTLDRSGSIDKSNIDTIKQTKSIPLKKRGNIPVNIDPNLVKEEIDHVVKKMLDNLMSNTSSVQSFSDNVTKDI